MSNITPHWTKDEDGRHWEAQGERGAYKISRVPDTPKDCYYGASVMRPKASQTAWAAGLERKDSTTHERRRIMLFGIGGKARRLVWGC